VKVRSSLEPTVTVPKERSVGDTLQSELPASPWPRVVSTPQSAIEIRHGRVPVALGEKRSVLDYILSPITQVREDAFGDK